MTKKKKRIHERPIDPSRNAADLIGDTSGLTGITTGSAKQSSAEPDDINFNEDNEPGGVRNFPGDTDTGIPEEAVNDKVYNQHVRQGMSTVAGAVSDDTADDATMQNSGTNGNLQNNSTSGNQPADDDTAQNVNPPSVTGEESVSGDMPDPESDDDTLANAQAVGTQLGEDSEHPEELDIGRDIDEAEEYIRTH